MRVTITTTIALAALLLSGAAGAAGGGTKETPGKGASAPAAPSSGPSEGFEPLDARGSADRPGGEVTHKVWEAGASWEYHRLLRQEDLGGAGRNKNVNYFGTYGRWDITENNRVSVRLGVYQYFLADQGESGFRFDDMLLTYTRRFPLPAEVTARVSGSLILPTSYDSRRASLIIAPRLTLQADRKFGKYFTLDARLSATGFVCKYASYGGSSEDGSGGNSVAPGGVANTKFSGSGLLSGDFAMPFHEPLSVGASLYLGYRWLYDVYSAAGPNMSVLASMKMPTDANYSQPTKQSYGGEIYVRYAFPNLRGFRSDLTLALAQGDPTLGYASVIHDGAQHVYASYRQTGEFYGVLAARY